MLSVKSLGGIGCVMAGLVVLGLLTVVAGVVSGRSTIELRAQPGTPARRPLS